MNKSLSEVAPQLSTVILPIDFQTDRQTQSHIIVGNVVDAALGLDSTIDHVRETDTVRLTSNTTHKLLCTQ